MEGFATGFDISGATRPGFCLENDKFRVTFQGVLCNKVRNMESHVFESCYDWRPVMDIVLQAASQSYSSLAEIEARSEARMRDWLTSFPGWGLLASILPPLKHRYFLAALAYTSANWNPGTGGELSEEKVFEAVKTVYDHMPGRELSTLLPKFGMWFEEIPDSGIEEQRMKNFHLSFNAKWVLEATFEVEKLRVNRSLLERAAEVVVRRLELEQEVRQMQVPRTLLPAVLDKFRDAQWVRSFWQHKADLETAGEDELEDRLRDFRTHEFRPLANQEGVVVHDYMDTVENRLWGDQEEEEAVEEQKEVEMEEEGSVIGASLWWAFYVLMVFFAYVCS